MSGGAGETRSEAPPREADAAHALSRLFGRDSLYVLLWGLQLALAALVTPAATRLLVASAYGRVMSATAVMQVLVAIGGMGLQSAVQRQYAREDGERLARRLVTLAVAVAVATFLLGYLTGPLWARALGLRSFDSALRYAVGWAALSATS
ncbi:MAG TPA: hypothetical protein VL977_05760, partial [Solirubrobacteraceae bacterium]|nr:hypothetical protein [Solirubrobacteraceae bacterium]